MGFSAFETPVLLECFGFGSISKTRLSKVVSNIDQFFGRRRAQAKSHSSSRLRSPLMMSAYDVSDLKELARVHLEVPMKGESKREETVEKMQAHFIQLCRKCPSRFWMEYIRQLLARNLWRKFISDKVLHSMPHLTQQTNLSDPCSSNLPD
jgi:hypothetical protein